jgi:hypothetical protein
VPHLKEPKFKATPDFWLTPIPKDPTLRLGESIRGTSKKYQGFELKCTLFLFFSINGVIIIEP